MSTGTRKRLSRDERREVIELAASEVFAERGYNGASIDEIARRSSVSPPVVYDHFDSKLDLHRALLERHYAELRELWSGHMAGDAPLERRLARGIDAWFAYVEAHPFAGRLLFRDTSGNPEVEAVRRSVADASRDQLLPLLAAEPGIEQAPGPELAWEVFRAILQGLALWWYEHPEVPRELVVTTAMNGVWMGFERVMRGEVWRPDGD